MKNWRTFLIGLLGAVSVAVYPIIATGEIVWQNIGAAALIATFGYFAKDKNVTGVGEQAETLQDRKKEGVQSK